MKILGLQFYPAKTKMAAPDLIPTNILLLTPMQYRYGSILELETFKLFSADLVNESENMAPRLQTE